MIGKTSTQNNRQGLTALSSITGQQEFLLSTAGVLQTTGGGSGGGSTQYANGASTTAAVGNALVYSTGSTFALVSSANPLPITGSISVGSATDESAFTAGISNTGPIAGVFNDSLTILTSGQQGTTRLTGFRALHMNLRNSSGNEIGISGTPIRVDPTGTTTQPVSNGGTFSVQNTAATPAGTNAIGSITNTSFAATQATAANLNATIVGTGTLATQVTSLPALPAGANTIGAISNTSFTATQATGTNLHTVVDSGSITATPPTLPSAPIFGQKAVTSTVGALASNALVNGVIIESLSTNTVSVFVGGTSVTASTGIELLPGGSTSVAVSNTSSIGVITASGTATVTFIGS